MKESTRVFRMLPTPSSRPPLLQRLLSLRLLRLKAVVAAVAVAAGGKAISADPRGQ
jgi:hypothetical protein